MTPEEYRARVTAAKVKVRHFTKVRNAWRKIVTHRTLQLKEALERRKKKGKPHRSARNVISGGTPAQRLTYAMQIAHKIFRAEYSEAGTWTKGFGLTNVPGGHGFRTDCSWWVTMLRYACRLEGPSLEGGYTGTILTEGKAVDRKFAENHPGVCVVFGSGTGFHVALSKGNGTPETYGHGVPEIDISTFDAFGPGTEVRFRAFPDKEIKA
jgi:hypothetical protein